MIARTRLHVSKRGAREPHVGEYVCLEGPLQVTVIEFREFLAALLRGVGNENVDAPEGLNGALHCRLAELRIGEIARDKFASTPAFDYCGTSRLGVTLFFGQVHDGDIRPFSREQHRHRAANAGVATGDEGALARELARGLVARRLEPRCRLQRRLETRRLLTLLRKRWLRFLQRSRGIACRVCVSLSHRSSLRAPQP